MQEALQSRSPRGMKEIAVHHFQLSRHSWNTYWVKDVILGTGDREMSNANSFILCGVAKMLRIRIATLLTSIDHFLCSRHYSKDSTCIVPLAFLSPNNTVR